MNQRILRMLSVFGATCVSISYAGTEEQASFRKASECYARLAPQLVSTNLPFADFYNTPFALNEMGMDLCSDYMGKHSRVRGQFDFWFNSSTGKMICVGNHVLREYVRTNEVQTVPQLSVGQAMERAKKYMDIIGIRPPAHMSLSTLSFHTDNPSCWTIIWEPIINGFAFDTFVAPFVQKFQIVFHEKYGFVGFYEHDAWPHPKQTVVTVHKESAILKASQAVPLIQRSPYYLQARLPGFAVSGLYRAELLVAAPNWLLDPKRAVWLRDKPPEETRLCWMVAFTSVYTGKTEPGELLVPPLFLVYIDAATGEIVGANFT